MIQILYSAIGVLIAIGIIAAACGVKAWFDRFVQRHEEIVRNLHSRIDCVNRRLDRIDNRFEAVYRWVQKNPGEPPAKPREDDDEGEPEA